MNYNDIITNVDIYGLEKGFGHACYEKQSCLGCKYGTNKIGGINESVH